MWAFKPEDIDLSPTCSDLTWAATLVLDDTKALRLKYCDFPHSSLLRTTGRFFFTGALLNSIAEKLLRFDSEALCTWSVWSRTFVHCKHGSDFGINTVDVHQLQMQNFDKPSLALS